MTNEMLQDEYNHLVHDIAWYKKRMEQYRESFWNVCEKVKTSNNLNDIKEFTKKEYERY